MQVKDTTVDGRPRDTWITVVNEDMQVKDTTVDGRPRDTWITVVNMQVKGLIREDASDGEGCHWSIAERTVSKRLQFLCTFISHKLI